jgi:cytochrome b561
LQPIFGLLLVTTSKNEPVAYGVIPLKIARNDMLHEIGEWLHVINAYAIVGLVALHILAALYHHLVLKDNVLKRMLPFAKV